MEKRPRSRCSPEPRSGRRACSCRVTRRSIGTAVCPPHRSGAQARRRESCRLGHARSCPHLHKRAESYRCNGVVPVRESVSPGQVALPGATGVGAYDLDSRFHGVPLPEPTSIGCRRGGLVRERKRLESWGGCLRAGAPGCVPARANVPNAELPHHRAPCSRGRAPQTPTQARAEVVCHERDPAAARGSTRRGRRRVGEREARGGHAGSPGAYPPFWEARCLVRVGSLQMEQ